MGLEVIPLCLEAAEALTRPNLVSSKTFCFFPWVETSTAPGGFIVSALLMTGATEGPTENGIGYAGN